MRTAAILLLGLCLAASACSKPVDEPGASAFKPTGGEPLPPGPSELQIEDTQTGTGDRAVKTGDKIKVHYTGTLMNGRKFDSSRDRKEPFEFTVGEGVIAGWSQGVVGMKKGGKRKLTIPAALGYGKNGQPPTIPGDAGLKFDIELLDFSQ
jgi:FKBP-type peptidyl-prolyl cis-trans isomerase